MPKVTKQPPPARTQAAKPKAGGVLSRIKDLEFSDDDPLKVLVYGPSGSGKTTFWGSFPGKILAIISSGIRQPGELKSLDTPENRKKIKTVNLEKSSELGELIEMQRREGTFSTLVLDHASGLQDKVLAEILGIEQLPAQLSWGLATQQQYGQCTQQCKEYLRALLGLDCNVVIVAQERAFNTEDDGGDSVIMPWVGAALTPSLTGWLNPACDYIVETFKRQRYDVIETKVGTKTVTTKTKAKGIEFCLRCGPDAIYMTKFRVPKGSILPDVIVDPTYEKFLQVTKGG